MHSPFGIPLPSARVASFPSCSEGMEVEEPRHSATPAGAVQAEVLVGVAQAGVLVAGVCQAPRVALPPHCYA